MAMPVVFVHFTSAEEVMSSLRLFVCLFVCLFVSGITQKLLNSKFGGKVSEGPRKNLQILVVIRITIR